MAAASTGTIAMMLPPGTPGTAKVVSTTVKMTTACCGGEAKARGERNRERKDADRRQLQDPPDQQLHRVGNPLDDAQDRRARRRRRLGQREAEQQREHDHRQNDLPP